MRMRHVQLARRLDGRIHQCQVAMPTPAPVTVTVTLTQLTVDSVAAAVNIIRRSTKATALFVDKLIRALDTGAPIG